MILKKIKTPKRIGYYTKEGRVNKLVCFLKNTVPGIRVRHSDLALALDACSEYENVFWNVGDLEGQSVMINFF